MAKNLGFCQAKNYSSRGRWAGKQDVIVLHTTAGAAGLDVYERNTSKSPAMFSGTQGWFCHPTTTAGDSSHFITDRGGRFLQVVDLAMMAWCNGNNATTRNLPGVVELVRQRVDNCNMYSYSIESEGTYGSVGDPPGTDEQLDAILACIYICIDDMHKNGVTTFVPDNQHIIGHCHVRPDNRSQCPAANFAAKYPWDYIRQKAKEYCDKKYPGWISGGGSTGATPPSLGSTDGGNLSGATNTTGIKVGDKVTIMTGATWYGSTSKIAAAYTSGRVFSVDELKGDRAVLDKTGICSPINVKYLNVVTAAEEPKPEVAGSKFAVGDKVVINAGATWYNGANVPNWCIGGTYTIDELTIDKALLDKNGICSPINVKYLTKVSGVKLGDKVKILAGATWYNGKAVPEWCYAQSYTVDELDGDRALLSKTGINSPIDVKYLETV